MKEPVITQENAEICPDEAYKLLSLGRNSIYNENHARALFEHYNLKEFYEKKMVKRKVSHSMIEVEVEVPKNLPTVSKYCHMVGIGRTTFYRWVKEHEEFRNIYNWGKIVLEDMLGQLTLNGSYEPQNAMLMAKISMKYDSDLIQEEKEAEPDEDVGLVLPYYVDKQPTMDDFNKVNGISDGKEEAIQDIQASKDLQQD